MIIQIRGTSGSGKSTAMKKIMTPAYLSLPTIWEPVYREGRKKPLYYRQDNTVVLGHYESPCGGVDTIGSARAYRELIGTLSVDIEHIFGEGLLLSEDVKWTTELSSSYEVRVVFLTTPLGRCLDNIRKRRAEVGNEKELNVTNTENRVGVIERARLKLISNGVPCYRASANQAPGMILKWLRLHA